MNVPQVSARLLVGAIVVTTAACGSGASSVPVVPSGGGTPQMRTLTFPRDNAPKSKTYQWVTGSTEAVQYDYPKSTSPIGSISGLNEPTGECTSGKRTFWIVNAGNGDIDEYTYNGKKHLTTLTDTTATIFSCAVSSKNGDVAVIGYKGRVIVFKGGKQSGAATYNVSGLPYFAGYDAKGDLFIDGFSTTYQIALLELASGSKTFHSVSLPNTVGFPGSVQWDGKYVALTDQLASDVYRYTIANYAAKLNGTVSLGGADDCGDTWIAKPYLFCNDAGKLAVDVYSYPAGGESIATLDTSMSYGILGNIIQVTK
jgi:hypothetical protein